MEEFKSLSLGEIKNKVESTQNLFLVSVNYDKKGGIRLEKDIEPSKLDTILEEVKNFYKLYIFNEQYGRLKVRIGKIGEREIIQYIKFGGEN